MLIAIRSSACSMRPPTIPTLGADFSKSAKQTRQTKCLTDHFLGSLHQFACNREFACTPTEAGTRLRYNIASLSGVIFLGRSLRHETFNFSEIGGFTQYLRVYIGQIRAKPQQLSGLAATVTSESGIGYRMIFCTVTLSTLSRTARRKFAACAGTAYESNGKRVRCL